MHGYVVSSRIGTFAWTTSQPEFSIYSEKHKYVLCNLVIINK